MAIVSISRGANSHGAEVAEKTARRLGYRCVSREAVLRAAGDFHIPEDELIWALEHPPMFFERSVSSKEHFVTAVEATLLHQFSDDDIVYHGFAGHYFARNIKNALKVRVLAEMSDRVASSVECDQLTAKSALKRLDRLDRARSRWGRYLYGSDPQDPTLYDIVLHVGNMGTDGAAEIICTLVNNETFRMTTQSCQKIRDMALVASVRASLADLSLDINIVDVAAVDGAVRLVISEPGPAGAHSPGAQNSRRWMALRRLVDLRTRSLPGLKSMTLKPPPH